METRPHIRVPGEPIPALLEAMRVHERRRQALAAQLADLGRPRSMVTDATIYAELSRRLTDWQGLLERHANEEGARALLRAICCAVA